MWLGDAGVKGNYPRFLPSSTSRPRRIAKASKDEGVYAVLYYSVALPIDENQRERSVFCCD